MADQIAVTDVKLKYASIKEARAMSGLRLILGANAVPGPWREACKGIFHVKKIPYTPVASAGQDGSPRELIEWTAQSSAPVIDKLGMILIRVLPDSNQPTDPDQPFLLHVATPSGKSGYIDAQQLSPLGGDEMCYTKDAGGWKIAGYLGGVSQ